MTTGVLLTKILLNLPGYVREDLQRFREYKWAMNMLEEGEIEDDEVSPVERYDMSRILCSTKNVDLHRFLAFVLSGSQVPFGWCYADLDVNVNITAKVRDSYKPDEDYDRLLWHRMNTPFYVKGIDESGKPVFDKCALKNVFLYPLKDKFGNITGHLNRGDNISFRERNHHGVELISLETLDQRVNAGEKLCQPKEWFEVNNDFGWLGNLEEEWMEAAYEERIKQFERLCLNSTLWTIVYDFKSKWFMPVSGVLANMDDKETNLYADAYE